MTPFLVPIFLLCLSSLSTAANFNLVYQWNELDYEWPSEASRTQAIENGTYNPQNIKVRFMAVFGTRIFLSLHFSNGIPVTLVSLPTISASFASPKLTPFPSWDMHGYGDCNKIEEATGLEVDSSGRLWVLDEGSDNCNAKLWIFNNNHTEHMHRFSFRFYVNDLVLDEARNGTLAYISRRRQRHIVVFSLDRNQSWMVETPGIEVLSFALSPKSKEEPRQLYLSKWNSNELYSISVDALRKGTAITVNPKLIGKWTASDSYRMLMDNRGTLHAAFWGKNYMNSWNTSQPFEEQRFQEVTVRIPYWPFTCALDQSGTLWMTVFDADSVPKLRLLKAAVDDSPK